MSLAEYFPVHAWIAVIGLGAIAVLVFFLPPSVAGLTIGQYILVVAVVELGAALGIAAIVVYYRAPKPEQREWRFGP
jgi:uncharacterized membrane protein YedE/YeeE